MKRDLICGRDSRARAWTANAMRTLGRGFFCLPVLGLLLTPAWAQEAPEGMGDKSLEDLMNIQVSSASKKEQKLSRVAAAVFIITQEDIRHSGATNVPDLLRMVPGVQVGQINGSTWAISSRGFNGQFSDKLLVMIDDRIVYTPNFAGVYWDTQDLPLEDIEKIEVIRGPGGTVWGANAVNGVISIFTKKTSETLGGMIVAGGGNIDQGFGTTQYGGKLSKKSSYRMYAKYFNQGHLMDLTGANGEDGWHMLRGGFRVDSTLSAKDSVTTTGDLYTAREGELAYFLPSVTSPALVPVPHEVNMGGGFLQSTWDHVYSDRSDSRLQVSFSRYRRGDSFEPESRDTFDVDYKHHAALGQRHDIVWGTGYHYTTDSIGGSLTVFFNPASRALQVFNFFMQDEIALIRRQLYVTVGAKLEHNDYTGFELMPSVRVTWTPSDRHMLWSAVSLSNRVPSRNDTNLVVNVGTGGGPYLVRISGSPSFGAEEVIAYEAGYRTTIAGRISLDFAAYFNHYDAVQTTEPAAPFFEALPAPAHQVLPFSYQNLMHGETHGIEVAANWKVTNQWTLSPGYALERIHMHTNPKSQDTITPPFIEKGSPVHGAQLRSRLTMEHGWTWEASAYFLDRLSHQGYSTVAVTPAYVRLDTGLTWSAGERFSISLVGQNLLANRHIEFQDVFGSIQSGLIKRRVYAKFTWKF